MNFTRIYLIILFLLTINILLSDNLITDDFYFRSFSGQMSQDMIMKLLDIRHKYDWVSYVISPLLVTIKMFFIAGLLYTGSIFTDSKIRGIENFNLLFY